MSEVTETKLKPEQLKTAIENQISEWIAPLGYEIVALEFSTSGQRTLRLYIDKLDATKVGIGDCVVVSKTLNEPLDALKEIELLYSGAPYELEVSSPGVDRPLKKPKDFQRYSGKLARIHVFRPLNAEEIKNAEYQAKNPKQKNFIGTLMNVEGSDLVIEVQAQKEPSRVCIPLGLISKANLEPVYNFSGDFSEERKSKA